MATTGANRGLDVTCGPVGAYCSPVAFSTMYAVNATGGKQYRVEEGQRVLVERLGR
ncbi:MAG: hypothetical protein CM1200mP26_20370 [Acidimicrobiales bacterium]|nr:MAG: hypothetical protein CM1200mP26_20370 [Acidimicrobiales bacterium]